MPQAHTARQFAIVILAIGLALPFVTWVWAKLTGFRMVFAHAPDLILVSFNFASFLMLAALALGALRTSARIDATGRFVRAYGVTGGLLGLLAISIHLHMHYWLSTSSTTALIFLFYLPYTLFFIAAGYGLGWLIGRLQAALLRTQSHKVAIGIKLAVLAFYVVLNVYASNFGRFGLPARVGAITQDTLLHKESFFDAPPQLGAITSLSLKPCHPEYDGAITVTGRGGAAAVSTDGALRSFTKFERVAGFYVYPVDVEGNGVCAYVDNAGGWSPVGLIDHRGKRMWAYGKNMSDREDEALIAIAHSPRDIIAFDADGDQRLDFLIPLLIVERQETHVLSQSGTVMEKLDYDLQGSKTADIDGDGKAELISLGWSRHGGKTRFALTLRDNRLAVVKRILVEPRRGANNLTTLRMMKWPDTRGRGHAVINNKDRLQVIDPASGAVVYELDLELHYLGQVTPVRLIGDHEPYLAIAQAYKRRVMLSLYDPDKKLVYQEILRRGVYVTALAVEGTGREALLVTECGEGLCGKIWRYSLKVP